MSRSLTVRTIAASLVWIVVALGAGGWVISEVFARSAARQFDIGLESELDLLTASIARSQNDPASQMINPDYFRVFSGHYWQAENDADTVFRSRSLWDTKLAIPEVGSETAITEIAGPDGQTLRLVARNLRIPNRGRWRLAVAANSAVLQQETKSFQRTLLISGTALGSVLLLAAILLLKTALSPLKALRKAVIDRHRSESGQIDGTFPTEISPLVDDLNLLLQRNERLREKGRLQAANLAHTLKTPAAILRNELAKAARGETMNIGLADQAVENVSAAADRHLSLVEASVDDLFRPVETDMVPVADDVIRAIGRLFSTVAFELEAADRIPVYMSRSDQMELLGNLIENAGKWAQGNVLVKLSQGYGHSLISVEDDGPGVPDSSYSAILQQGVRLDEMRSGSGLGLTIVADIVERHNGQLSLGRSALAGLSVTVTIPAQT